MLNSFYPIHFWILMKSSDILGLIGPSGSTGQPGATGLTGPQGFPGSQGKN